MDLSCSLATALDAPELVAHAEALGYTRAWLYDTPQQSPDVWMLLALAAERTSRIGIGPGVLVPSLRHPMVNAAATAALVALAPGRVAVGFGSGFTGRRAMGHPAMRWADVEAYVRAYRGLLRGETVEWEGARMRMLHPEGHGAPRPVEVPVLIGAMGPRSDRVARALGDGVLLTGAVPETAAGHPWIGFLAMGTVLEEGEDVTSPRVRATAGPALAVAYHATYELGGDVAALPGGQAWLDVAEAAPEAERHLLVHDHHVVALNAADAAAWDAGAHAALREMTLTGTRDELAARIRALADQGVDELVFQAAGPDPRRELEAFHGVASAALA